MEVDGSPVNVTVVVFFAQQPAAEGVASFLQRVPGVTSDDVIKFQHTRRRHCDVTELNYSGENENAV
jgi:hypothetical protein